MNRNQTVSSILLMLFIFPYQCFAQPSAPRYAIKNVTVISMSREEPMLNQTVLIDSGYISRIEPTEKIKVDKGYTVIDGTGKYLLPGLFDMHVHFYQDRGEHINTTQTELKLMLAKGITHARVMAGHPDHLRARDNVRNEKWIGPALTIASPEIGGPFLWDARFSNYELITSADHAIKAVRRFKRQGYDVIKVSYLISTQVFDAIVKTAREENMKVVGHAGSYIKLPNALKAKMQIEHLAVFMEALLPEKSYYAQEVAFNWFTTCAVDTVGIWYFDESKIPSIAQAVKKAGILVTPTINTFSVSQSGNVQKPEHAYIPSVVKKRQSEIKTTLRGPQQSLKSQKRVVEIRKKIVYELWKADVPLMAGSDYTWVNGFSLHDELSAMVDAGLTPYAALQTATINPATYLNKDRQIGTIEVGKQATVLLLDKNPLIDIHNTQSIIGLFKGFNWYNQSALEKMLDDVKILGK